MRQPFPLLLACLSLPAQSIPEVAAEPESTVPIVPAYETRLPLIIQPAPSQDSNILIALILNMVVVYTVLRLTSLVERLLGASGLHILKKFFGVILLSIAIKLFLTNTGIILPHD